MINSTLQKEIEKIAAGTPAESEENRQDYITRLKEGELTRDENSASHFCVYFLPYNRNKREVFLVHHKKSGLWLSPGGHIDKGESLLEALNREIEEELGIKNFFEEAPLPFFLTITPINNLVQPCKRHYDIWYIVETDGKNFAVNSEEFLDYGWLTIEKAMKKTADLANQRALKKILEP